VKVGGFVWRLYFISGSSVVTEEGEREEMREGVRRKGAGGDRAAGLPRLGFQPVSPFRWIRVRDFCSFKTSDLPLNRTC
jgi:hypothetical protein